MSITAGERKALLFLTSLLTLGGGVRLVHSRRDEPAVVVQTGATPLAAQIDAVDSARGRRRSVRQSRGKAPRMRAAAQTRTTARINTDSNIVIDVDRATAAELELLPRVGPALAQRIISNREQFGAFGSLDAFSRVKGIGPKLVTRLAAHVTFSGSMRPSSALSVSPGSVPNSSRPPPPG